MEKLLEKLNKRLEFLKIKYSIKIQNNNIIITNDGFPSELIRVVLGFCDNNDVAFYIKGNELIIYKYFLK